MHTSDAVTPLKATYAASTEGLAQALSQFDRLSADSAWTGRLAHSLRLVLEELIINVVTHGRQPGGTGWFSVQLTLVHDSVTLVIEDNGLPFDPTAKVSPDLDAPLDDRRVGGLGLFLARSLSDEFRYVREQDVNRTTAVFLLAAHHD